MDYMVQDLLTDDNIETLLNTLFISDKYIDFVKLIDLLESRAKTYKDKFSAEEKECFENVLEEMKTSRKLQMQFLFKLKDALMSGEDPNILPKLDYTMFWSMFPIAIKKCLNAPTAVVNKDEYYSIVSALSESVLSPEQVATHNLCIQNFNFNANIFPNSLEQLAVFLHPMRSFKRTRTKKKHLSRVLKKANKMMIAHKIMHRESQDIVFRGRAYKTPDQFTKAISHIFLSKE